MAQGGAQLDPLRFSCSVCLDLLEDPVTVPCGHSYCSGCIKGHWDEEDSRGAYSCPQCRRRFQQRPGLQKNVLLAELVEDLRKTGLGVEDLRKTGLGVEDLRETGLGVEDLRETGLGAAAPGLCSAGPEDVACDVCPGRKLKAVRSCLVCLASYCEEHLQGHYHAAPLQKHQLVAPSERLRDRVCSVHDEVMKVFCRTDQQCICYLCTMDQHRGHDTVPAAAERRQKQQQLEGRRRHIWQSVREREQRLQLLRQQVEAVGVSADRAVEHSRDSFAHMIRLIQSRSLEVERQLRSQQQAAVGGLKALQEQLQQEITELRRTDVQLEQLARTEDHHQFLLGYTAVAALRQPTPPPHPPGSHGPPPPGSHGPPLTHFEDVAAAVSESREKVQELLREAGEKLLLLLLLPESRADLLQYSQLVTLDPNSAHRQLILSDGGRKVTSTDEVQPYSDHPDRFTGCSQVLSRESLTGRSYWEVEWRGGVVGVAVTYKNISRAGRGEECLFGYNDKSWALHCSRNSLSFYHNSIRTPLSGPRSSRVGVYLDHRAGLLSFYSVSETMTLLHRVQTTFTQPLHAGLCLNGAPFLYYFGSSAELVKPQ